MGRGRQLVRDRDVARSDAWNFAQADGEDAREWRLTLLRQILVGSAAS